MVWCCICQSGRFKLRLAAALWGIGLGLFLTAPLAASEWVTAPGPGLTAARFEAPDTVYPHRVLGQIPEMRVLAARDDQGRDYRIDLRDRSDGIYVFEDIAPRIVDATGDGRADLVVVQSEASQGARLVVYELSRGGLQLAGQTPFIGQPFRWLAPAAIADLDGDGVIEIAYVETPHLGKTLRIWSWAPGGLTEIARLKGVSNHRIGEESISGGLRDCGSGPEIVLAQGDWRDLVAISLQRVGNPPAPAVGEVDGMARLENGGLRLQHRRLGLPANAAGFAKALACKD